MYLPKNINLSTISINNYYLPWLISFFVATTLILIILVIVIIICSSFKNKQKLNLINSTNDAEVGIFVVNGNSAAIDKMKNDLSINKYEDALYSVNNRSDENSKPSLFCCCVSRDNSSQNLAEEGFGLLGNSKNIIKVDLREKERHLSMDYANNQIHESIPDLSATASDGMSEAETVRISHFDRELPPIPKVSQVELKTSSYTNSMVEPEIVSITESENYNELKPSDETDNDQQNFVSCNTSTLSRDQLQSTTSSPKFDKYINSSVDCGNCCCGSRQEILSSDDLSSNDYDPTYAAIKRKKPSCPVCGVPSVYTPANSNRNSNLSLQFNSCLTSPIRNTTNQKPLIYDSLNNSTYASIAKIPKIIPETILNKELDKSGSSTIKRQRSISQGDIIRSSKIKSHGQQQIENKIKESHSNNMDSEKRSLNNHCIFNIPTLNTISLWSLMASNRDSTYNMFPLIPERTYGQSVVDLIEKLRESEQLNKSIKQPCFLKETGRSFTPPILFNNSYKKAGSFMYSRGRVWTPPSCHMVHGNASTKSGLCSPLKIFDRNSNSYDFNFPDIIGSYRKGNQIFQPLLTPPLSPMDCLNSENEDTSEVTKSILLQDSEKENEFTSVSELKFNDNNNNDSSVIQAASIYEDLDYESVSAVDNEIEVINDESNLSIKKSDDYLLKPDQIEINGKMKLVEYSDDSINSRTRPISIHLYADDSLAKDKSLKYRFEKCEIFGFSSVQMSPLMEQSIENSSSKTTLSSLSFHQFNRLISSEDSCAKSPPSAELSPSLDNFEISSENNAFLYNDLMWSKLNCAFDDYDTFE